MEFDAQEITCRRGAHSPFAAVSFRLRSGTALILRGPNGSGKTTLLRGLAGLLPLASGSLRLDGATFDPAEADITYSGHLDAVKGALTVVENLRFWANLHGSGNLDRAMTDFDLAALANTPAARLSAGQKRRLGLARLPLTGARIWLMDEPTISLDAANTHAVIARVERHLRDGGMAIIATHIPVDLPGEVLELSPAPRPEAEDPFLAGSMA